MENNHNLSDRTYQYLLEKIITNELKPGDSLNEQALIKELNISRTPYRAAIDRLHTMQLLETESGKAPRVRQFSLEDVTSLVETLIIIEKSVAKMATNRATPLDIEKINKAKQAVTQSSLIENPKEYVFKNESYHRAIAEAAHNTFIIQIHHQLRNLMQQLTYIALEKAKSGGSDGLQEYHSILSDQHIELAECIEKGDSAQAEKLSVEHLQVFHEKIIKYFTRLDVF